MKYLLMISVWLVFLLSLFTVPVVEAWDQASRDAAKAQSTCVYRYLACRDNCEYHQNQDQIRPCKANCNRKYSCRAKKINRPSDSSLYETN